MPNTLDTAAASQLVTLVTLRWHTNTARYCRWSENLTISGNVFTALPEMDIELDKFHGNANEKEDAKLLLPRRFEPFESMIVGTPQAYIQVDIEEIDPNDHTTRRWLHKGDVKSIRSNPDDKARLVEVIVGGLKDKLLISLGVVCASLCSWTFGDSQCQKNVTALKQTGTISTISGTAIIITGLTITTLSGYWKHGYVERNGIRLMIRSYSTGNSFVLIKPPPAAWLAQSVTVTPGCDKTIETCRGRWANEEHHGGFGRQMPDHDPISENADAAV